MMFSRLIFLFRLQLLFDFDEVIPGSAYSWKITGKSQGSNPLLRTYSFSESTLPMSPIPLMEAASALDNYDTFVLTIGNQLYVSSFEDNEININTKCAKIPENMCSY